MENFREETKAMLFKGGDRKSRNMKYNIWKETFSNWAEWETKGGQTGFHELIDPQQPSH